MKKKEIAQFDFDELCSHIGHKIVCVSYGDEQAILNVAIECEDCSTVLFDIDNPNLRDIEKVCDECEHKPFKNGKCHEHYAESIENEGQDN